MACRAVESWTLTSLVGAYLDLALAYLFLIGATIAFFASKLLSSFGLSLPCTCDGRFGHPTCAQTSLLVDFPTVGLAAVHRSLRSRFPFDSLLPTGASLSPRCRYAVLLPSDDGDSPLTHDAAKEEPLVQIKGVRPQPSFGDSISDLGKYGTGSAERISGCPWDSDDQGFGEEASAGEEKDSCSGVGGLFGCNEGGSMDTTISLERELEEERGARMALYLELEKERSAAASAANEAIAMILRLQKEKAQIDMESRQYQRMVEEKSAYDEEEMEILKEIIVRREREKHVLEKEVEMYKQMVNSGERVEEAFDGDQNFLKDKLDTLVDSSDDPMLMLQQIYKSIRKKEEANRFGVESAHILNSSRVSSNHSNFAAARKHVELFNSGDDCDQEFQEKSMLTSQSNPSSSNNLISSCAGSSVSYNLSVPFKAEYHKCIADLTIKDEGERDTLIMTRVPVEGLCRMECDATDQRCNESSQIEIESSILDVHVIDDGQDLQVDEDEKQDSIVPEEDSSFNNFDEMELNIRRSCSEITNRISLIDSLSRRASYLRSSLPSVASERYQLENEVEVLRKRLEIIRQGREKLSLYVDQKEKETFQLQLLEEIACQLKEIKKVTEPTKSLRRVSLPPPSSKIKGLSTGKF